MLPYNINQKLKYRAVKLWPTCYSKSKSSPPVPNQSFTVKKKQLRMNQALRVDPSGTIRIVLLEEFVSAVAEGNTFPDIRV